MSGDPGIRSYLSQAPVCGGGLEEAPVPNGVVPCVHWDDDITAHMPWVSVQRWAVENGSALTPLDRIATGPLSSYKVEWTAGVVVKVVLTEAGSKLILLYDGTATVPVTVHANVVHATPLIAAEGTAVALHRVSVLEFQPPSRSLILCPSNLKKLVTPKEVAGQRLERLPPRAPVRPVSMSGLAPPPPKQPRLDPPARRTELPSQQAASSRSALPQPSLRPVPFSQLLQQSQGVAASVAAPPSLPGAPSFSPAPPNNAPSQQPLSQQLSSRPLPYSQSQQGAASLASQSNKPVPFSHKPVPFSQPQQQPTPVPTPSQRPVPFVPTPQSVTPGPVPYSQSQQTPVSQRALAPPTHASASAPSLAPATPVAQTPHLVIGGSSQPRPTQDATLAEASQGSLGSVLALQTDCGADDVVVSPTPTPILACPTQLAQPTPPPVFATDAAAEAAGDDDLCDGLDLDF